MPIPFTVALCAIINIVQPAGCGKSPESSLLLELLRMTVFVTCSLALVPTGNKSASRQPDFPGGRRSVPVRQADVKWYALQGEAAGLVSLGIRRVHVLVDFILTHPVFTLFFF